jgi:hypothetical protein
MYYSNWDTPTGWRCPMCGRSFAPHVSECPYCNNKEVIYRSGTSVNDNEWWKKYLKQSQTGTPVKDSPSITTATATSNPNIKVTTWNNATTCEQNCESCDKYEKSCFGGTETTSSKAIISHRKPSKVTYDLMEEDILDSFIKHFKD